MLRYIIYTRKDPAPVMYLAVDLGDPSTAETFRRCGWTARGTVETDMTAEELVHGLSRNVALERDLYRGKVRAIHDILVGCV